jgi:hypothetical protein
MESDGQESDLIVPGLKLIDCARRQVCVVTPGRPYITVSYVWGLSSMVAHKVLGEAAQIFPRTVEDAMSVAKEVQIPYLWFDQYCIDQNDKKEKDTMISNMDQIYSGAELTIMVATETDSHYGLRGVSTNNRHRLSIDRGTPILGGRKESELHQRTESLVAGLGWEPAKPADRRPGHWPSWSSTALITKPVYYWRIDGRLPNELEVTFTHQNEDEESLLDYVQGKRNYMD